MDYVADTQVSEQFLPQMMILFEMIVQAAYLLCKWIWQQYEKL